MAAPTLESFWQLFRKATPNTDFEHVTVTFPSVADQDMVIATVLRPTDPEAVFYRVVDLQFISAPTTPCIYRDTSTTRRTWSSGNIILRCNVASVTAVLELFTKRV